MSSASIRIGTRGSPLSTWQTGWVADRLSAALPGRRIETVRITTRGDVHVGPLTELTESGLFTSELERALLDGRIDLAVHSLKDLPVAERPEAPVAAIPLRGDPADALLSRGAPTLAALPTGARVGTSSPRRACLIRAVRPDLGVVPLRGNVDTRVSKLEAGEYDAIVLAVAGLVRLGLADRITERLDPVAFPPAPGQGALAIQVAAPSDELAFALASIDDPEARRTSTAERVCLAALGGGCSRPIGAHAVSTDGDLTLVGFVGTPDGVRVLRARARGRDPETVGREVADALIGQGARELLA